MKPAWYHDLQSANWQKRRRAIERLAQEPPESLRQGLITLLRTQHQDLNALSATLQLIARIGDPLLQPLLSLLEDPDPEVRLYAAQALGILGHPQAQNALRRHTTDPDPRVRFHVFEALALLQAPQNRSTFLHALKHDHDLGVRYAALEGLARLHDPTLIPLLVPYLEEQDLAPQAAEALGQSQCALALTPLLQRGLWDEVWPAYAALARDLHGTAGGQRLIALAAQHLPPQGWTALLQALPSQPAEVHKAALPLLATLLQKGETPTLQRAAREWLLRLWHLPDLTLAVEEILRHAGGDLATPIQQGLEDEDPGVVASAARLCGEMRLAAAFPALLTVLTQGEPQAAAAAAWALGRLGDPHASEALLHSLAHPHPEVVQAALDALLALPLATLDADLRVRLEDPRPQVRAAALQGLSRLTPAEALDDLIAALDDPHPQVRQTAIQALSRHASPEAATVLRERLQSGPPEVQAAILRALGGRLPADLLPLLRELLRHPIPWVRLHACRALRAQPRLDEDTRKALHALLDDPLPPAQACALRTLSAAPDASLETQAARRLAAAEPDLRLAAAEALAACDTPAAVQYLLTALETWTEADRPLLWRALARMTVPQAQAALEQGLDDPQHTPHVLQALKEQPAPATLPLLAKALARPRWRALARSGWLRHPPQAAWEALLDAVRHAPPSVAPALLAEARFLPAEDGEARLRPWFQGEPALADAVCLILQAWQRPLPTQAPPTPNCVFWSSAR